MRLNHLDLPVPDVALAASFFETFFAFEPVETKGNHGMAILKGDGGFVLVLTRVRDTPEPSFAKTFHIGFLLDSEHAVRSMHHTLAEAGLDSLSSVSQMRGSTQFYCHAPGGLLVEVGYRPQAVQEIQA